MSSALHNLNNIKAEIIQLSREYNYSPVAVMAVSKTQPPHKIIELLQAGHILFGENRVQEAVQKWPELKNLYPKCQLHLIGRLQTNKVDQAVRLFDMIETLDRPKLADSLAACFQKLGLKIPLLIQVNTGCEPQKSGVFPQDIDNFYNYCRQLNLPIQGLMCIPPLEEDPAPHFKLLHDLRQKFHLSSLSMGMSHDYRSAIKYGSSWLRIGTALFGER